MTLAVTDQENSEVTIDTLACIFGVELVVVWLLTSVIFWSMVAVSTL